jgi:hypothetical protein
MPCALCLIPYTSHHISSRLLHCAQLLFTRTILSYAKEVEGACSVTSPVSPLILDAVRSTLRDQETDRSLLAYTLTLPSLATLGEYTRMCVSAHKLLMHEALRISRGACMPSHCPPSPL